MTASHLLILLLIVLGPFVAVSPAVLAARTNGPVFSSRRRPAYRSAVLA